MKVGEIVTVVACAAGEEGGGIVGDAPLTVGYAGVVVAIGTEFVEVRLFDWGGKCAQYLYRPDELETIEAGGSVSDPVKEWHETHLAPSRHEEAVREYYHARAACNYAVARRDEPAAARHRADMEAASERIERERGRP